MSRRTGDSLEQRVHCPCGGWHWRPADASNGPSATERWCPRCERAMLVVFRAERLLGVAPLTGRNSGSYEEALDDAAGEELSEIERQSLVLIAQARAGEVQDARNAR